MIELNPLFSPRGIAVVGASADVSRIGGQPIKALLDAGYTGAIYPVNPKHQSILGLQCFSSIEAIVGPCDLAIIAVRADQVPDVVRSCGARGIRYGVILSGGFSEIGSEGRTLQKLLILIAHENNVRIIGPNCQGLISVPNRLFAVFGAIARDIEIGNGNVSMVFQSGGFGFSIVTLCDQLGIGFRHCVSSGNEADVTSTELLDSFLDEPGTEILCTYIEGIRDGRELMRVGTKSLTAGKPILVWKGGKSRQGSRAAASHTASMTGRYDIFRAVARQSGLIEVDNVEEMADLIRVFSPGLMPQGYGVGVMGISGGSGIVFADKAAESGLNLPELSPDTTDKLKALLPSFGSSANPVDVTAGIFNDISAFTNAVTLLLADPNIDQLCVLLASLPGTLALKAAETIAQARKLSNKPIHVAWSARRTSAESAYEVLENAKIPIVPSPVRLASAVARLARFASDRRAIPNSAQDLVTSNMRIQPASLTPDEQPNETEAKKVLEAYGISVTHDIIVQSNDSLDNVFGKLRPPLAVKILSKDIQHKTDIGAVELNISSVEELSDAVDRVRRNSIKACPNAIVQGVLVSEMICNATEAIVGVINDDAFGPIVAFGLGGIYTEVLHDISYRAAPFGHDTAMDMINQLRGKAVFYGVRNSAKLNIEKLAETLVAVSQLAWDLKDHISELDINPLFVRPNDCIAADALLLVKQGASSDGCVPVSI